MNKQKVFEIAKVATASVLSILMFSTVLRGINQVVFAAATETPTAVEQTTESVSIPDHFPSDDTPIPVLTIIESPWQRYTPLSTYAMPREYAAQIGAEFIREMFGACIDGMTIEMSFAQWPSHSRSYWMGSVYAQSAQEVKDVHAQREEWHYILRTAVDERGMIPEDSVVWDSAPDWIHPVYNFTICAITGERVDISRCISGLSINGNTDIRGELSLDDHMFLRRITYSSELTAEQLELYSQRAKEFAHKHFNLTTAVDVEFIVMNFLGLGKVDERMIVTDYWLTFNVTDDTGRVADVNMTMYSSELVSIFTQCNDIIPGFTHHHEIVYEGRSRG